MPEEMLDSSVTATTVTQAEPEAPLGATPPVPPSSVSEAVQTRQEAKVVTVPTSAMKRIKEEEYTKGKNAALEELVRSAGFDSSTDLVQALAKLKSAPAPAPTPTPVRSSVSPEAQASTEEIDPAQDLALAKDARRREGQYQRQIEKVLNERNRYAQSATDWQRKAKEAQAEVDAVRAEMHLRMIAASSGIQDVDYAITLFSREVEKLTPEQAEKFDEKAFFDGLRKSKPILFGEMIQPATTGTGIGSAPMAPKPAAVAAQNGASGRVDVRGMTPREYAEHLQKRGINPLAG